MSYRALERHVWRVLQLGYHSITWRELGLTYVTGVTSTPCRYGIPIFLRSTVYRPEGTNVSLALANLFWYLRVGLCSIPYPAFPLSADDCSRQPNQNSANEFISDVFRKWSLAYWPNNSTCWTISMIFNCSRFACSQFRNEFVRHSTVLPLPCVQCSIHNGSILVVSELHKTTKLTLTNPDLFPPSWSTN